MRLTPRLIGFALRGVAAAGLLAAMLPAATAAGDDIAEARRLGCASGRPHHAAIAACSQVIERYPGAVYAYAIRGNAYQALMKYDDALADLSRAIDLEPQNLFARSRRAEVHLEQKSREAQADIDFVLSAAPTTASDYEARSHVNSIDRHSDAALADIGKAIELGPRDPLLYAGRAAIHIARMEWQEAVDEAGKALRLAPELSTALAIRAEGNLGAAGKSIMRPTVLANRSESEKQRDAETLDRAVADVTAAIEQAPDEPRLHFLRGRVFELQFELSKARHDYEKALELAPMYAKARDNLGAIKRKVDQLVTASEKSPQPPIGEAQSDAPAVPYPNITADPRFFKIPEWPNGGRQADAPATAGLSPSAMPPFLEALIDLERGDFRNAVTKLDLALSINPNFGDAFVARAFARLRLHEVAAAMVDLDWAIEQFPNNERAYILRGEALASQGQFDSAFADFDQALVLNPNSAQAFAGRGNVNLARENTARAGKDFNSALLIDPKNVVARLGRAELDLRRGKRQAAIAAYKDVLAADPASVVAREGLERATSSADKMRVGSAVHLPMRVTVVRAAQPGCDASCPEWIYADGTINENTPARFRKALATIGRKKLPVFVNSSGGLSEAGYELGRLIRDRGLDVVVARTEILPCKDEDAGCKDKLLGIPIAANARCASACVFLLAGGARRFVGESAVVGVHRFTRYLTYKRGKRVIKTVRATIPKGAYKTAARFLEEMGVDKSIAQQMQSVPHEGILWLSRDELRASKVMTDETSGEELIATLTSPAWTVKEQQDAVVAVRKSYAEALESVQ
jgi:Tfp pilus assembly protein PilF